MSRPDTIIPETLPSEYPITGSACVIQGFGRGSSELGIPTANLPINDKLNKLEPGIYFGWSKVASILEKPHKETRNDGNEILFNNGSELQGEDLSVQPMVMSIGFNPFYNNDEKAAEIHIIHKFKENFYGASMNYTVLGYIRPELNYTTKEALINDINLDIKIALEALQKPVYLQHKDDVN